MGKKKKKKPSNQSRSKGKSSTMAWTQNLGSDGAMNRGKLTMLLLSVGAGVVAAQVVGNNSKNALISILTTAGGIYTKNMYLTAAGASMLLTTASKAENQSVSGLGFVGGAKARVGAFFETFKEKFKLPDFKKSSQSSEAPVEGFGSVYSNPLALQQGMNQLNEIERQLEQMNGTEEISDMPDREM